MILLNEEAGERAAADAKPPSLIVGRDDENHWVVVETHGLCGGIFATEAAAMRHAREESRGHPDAVRIAHYLVALNFAGPPRRRAWTVLILRLSKSAILASTRSRRDPVSSGRRF